jgi:hypothetical protein
MDRPTTAACIATLRQLQEEQDEPARLAAEAEAARVAAAQEAARLEAEEAAAAAREAERLLAEEVAATGQAERLVAEEVAAAARQAAQLEAEATAAAARAARAAKAPRLPWPEAQAAAARVAAANQARPDPDLQQYLEWAAGKGVEREAAHSMLSLSSPQDIASYASTAGQRAIWEAQQMIRESMQAAVGIAGSGNAPARLEPAIEPGTEAAAFASLPPILATELDPIGLPQSTLLNSTHLNRFHGLRHP